MRVFRWIAMIMLAGISAGAAEFKIIDAMGNEPILRRAVLDLAAQDEKLDIKLSNASPDDAVRDLASGKADVVICGQPDLKLLQTSIRGLRFKPYALEVLTAAVHLNNPVKNLTVSQLRNIFGGKTISWKEFNNTSYMIHKVALAPDQPGSISFYQLLLNGQKVMKDVYLGNTPDEPLVIASGTPSALAVALWGLRPELGTKLLSINGMEPSRKNIDAGKYPLAMHYYLCWRQDSPAIQKLLKLLARPEVIENAKLLPVRKDQ